MRMPWIILVWLLFLCLAVSACNVPIHPETPIRTDTPPATWMPIPPTATSTVIPSPTPAPVEHRIGVRVMAGQGEFYDRLTGEKFIPRGNNYIRLAQQTSVFGNPVVVHSTFNVGLYDPALAETALAKMQADGYNTVRVFLDCCATTGLSGENGLNPDYLDNVADFLRLAKKHEIQVMFALDWLPTVPAYDRLIGQSCASGEWVGSNCLHLSEYGVQAFAQFFRDFVQGLIARNAPLDYVFSYNVSNEIAFDSVGAPLDGTEGIIIAANGESYDLSQPAEKQRLMNEGLVFFIDTMRAAILELDPTAMVGVGFFEPQEPNPSRLGDTRVIDTRPAIWQSSADFIDLHAYPGLELTLAQYAENYGIAGMQEKPIVMGEMGGFWMAFPSAADAGMALRQWQVESCRYGFDGWLVWTWDSDEQGEIYTALSENEAINNAMAPRFRADACTPGEGMLLNLALDGKMSASAWQDIRAIQHLNDGMALTQWDAGASAPQWIEIDLQQPSTVTSIRLLVAQWPEGETTHQVFARTASADYQLVHTFQGYTKQNVWLEFSPEIPLKDIRHIRIRTVASPSWVAWRELQVIGSQP